MPDDLRTPRFEFSHVIGVLRNRWPSIVIILGAVLASAFYFTAKQVHQYRSEARVVLNSPLAGPGANPNTLFNMETEAGIAASPVVAYIALRDPAIDATDAADLLSGIEVETGGTQVSQILNFSYTNADPAEARDRAQALAEAYLQYRLDQLEATVEPLQDELLDAQEELDELRDEMGETDDPSRLAQLQSRATQLNSLMVVLQQRLGQALPGIPTRASVGDIVQPATLPTTPSGPNVARNLLFALVVGLLLAVGVAILRDAMADRVRDPGQMERAMNGRILAAIPKAHVSSQGSSSPLVVLERPDSVAAQGYGELRTAIQSVRRHKFILVTSANYGEGKSDTAANLGVALAQSGNQVIVVSADLRRPMLEPFFGRHRRKGLASLLQGKHSVDEVLVATRVPGLRLLPAGPAVRNASILLGLDRVGEVLDDLKSRAELIVIDAAPVLPVPDTGILAPHSDVVLLVADAAVTRGRSIAQAAEKLRRVPELSIVGVLIDSGRRWVSLQRSLILERSSFNRMDASSDGASSARRQRSGSRSA
jgi:capsular exopolysaccharide synthesis family protein